MHLPLCATPATKTTLAMSAPDLSLIVALYFEEECVAEFIRRIREELDQEAVSYEIIFVDDGSQDRTVDIVEEHARHDQRIKLLQLSRNHGKEAAVTAGIAHSSGSYIMMMDPDLQDPPDRIMDFYAKIREGYDLVFGVREQKNDSILNIAFSKLFWAFLNGLTGLNIPKNLAVMRIFNRRFAQEFLRYDERVRFIEGIFMSIGMRMTTMLVENHPRFAGTSKFNFRRKIRLALNAIVAFSERPIQLTVGTGFLLLAGTLSYGAWTFIRRLFFEVVLSGWTSTILIVLFIGSIQIILLGIIGNYVGRLYTETKRRPIFTVMRSWNLDRDDT